MSEIIIPPGQSDLVQLGQKRKTELPEEETYFSYLEYGQQFAGNHLSARQHLDEKIRRGEVPEYKCEDQLRHITFIERILKEDRARQEQWLREVSAPFAEEVGGQTGGNPLILASWIITTLRKLFG